ncbi:MAG: class IV adenylate cyclase [Solirubrobacterales bacterium]|nr:class IV adenylate cyclase [Solirubrobacterales bacterium]
MAHNVELKAHLPDPEAALARSLALGAQDQGTLHQRDTYFPARHGRLKLREIRGGATELIAYSRADTEESKLSTYEITPIADGRALRAALGVRVVVTKARRLLLLDNVRIHLDTVEGLGSFIEFEAVLGPDSDRAANEAKVAKLAAELEVGERVAVGYADLLE